MYAVAVAFGVPAERNREFIDAALLDGRTSLAAEPATPRFELVRNPDQPDQFYLNEGYAHEAAFGAHHAGEPSAAFFAAIRDFADGPTWLIRGTQVAGPGASRHLRSSPASVPGPVWPTSLWAVSTSRDGWPS